MEALIGRHPLLWASCRHRMLEVMPGDAFKVIFGSTSSSKISFFDILKSKWLTLDLSSVDLYQSVLTSLEAVDVYKRKAIESLHYRCTDKSTYFPSDDLDELP